MKFLFISEELIAGNVARLLHNAGHEVKLFIGDRKRRDNLDGLVPKTTNWRAELVWVGKNDGVIVFDDTETWALHDSLRKQGYYVFGCGRRGALLENDREYAQNLLTSLGSKMPRVYDFTDIDSAIAFVESRPSAWVIKKNFISNNSVSYVGQLKNGEDVVEVLRNYQKYNKENCNKITLQERITGVEIAIARYFNGSDWTSPIEINVEHNPFMPGDIGISTSEMGTIAWYTNNEQNKLFQQTLARVKAHLQSIDYRGVIDLNCIVNAHGVFPIEFTARFGSPIVHLQSEMLKSQWADLIANTAMRKPYYSHWKKGFGVVVFAVSPPFPFAKYLRSYNPKEQKIFFKKNTPSKHIHFEDVSYDKINNRYYISDSRGYIMYVTASGKTVEHAQQRAYKELNRIYFPKMMYRNDIGNSFIDTNLLKLKKWGYLN